jgi:glycosyltransferase involved in cell wall biosynthesis
MPVYNCESFIVAAIDSMLNQTLTAFELIIVDDCSTDKTIELISSYKDDRINFIQKKIKSGLVASLNIGINLSRGKYIARMDGDDISHSTRLEKQVNYLNQFSEIDLCGTAYELIGSQNIVSFPICHDDIKIGMLEYCPLAHPTVMLKKSFVDDNTLRYLNEFECAEDYELWTRCVSLGKINNMPDVLLSYRHHNNQFSITNKSNQDKNSAICRVNMLNQIWERASLNDQYTRELLFQNETFNNINKLNEVTGWMDELVNLNIEKACFDAYKFKDYIKTKKKCTIRRFYLNQTIYTPKVLYQFLKGYKNYKGFFSTLEYFKLALKCLVFWKLNFAKR